MKHCCTHTDTNLMIHLLPVNFSPAKMMLLCINSTKVNQYAGIFPPSVKMVLTEEDEVIIALCLIIMAVAMQNLEGRQVMRSSTGFLLRAIILLVFQYLCLKKRCLPCFMCEGKGLFCVYT